MALEGFDLVGTSQPNAGSHKFGNTIGLLGESVFEEVGGILGGGTGSSGSVGCEVFACFALTALRDGDGDLSTLC